MSSPSDRQQRLGSPRKFVRVVAVGVLLASGAIGSLTGSVFADTNETALDSATRGAQSSISLGEYTSCAVLGDGTVECWGSNYSGQLGIGTVTDPLRTPVAVPGLSDVTAIGLGNAHTCAVLSDSTVECWGYNEFGQLGDGTAADSASPVAVPGLSDVTAISLGKHHSCAVLGDGTVECWGNNVYGQLGDGTTTDSMSPVAVPELSDVTAISLGDHHSCAVLGDGTVECWGYNFYGQLGDGTTVDSTSPVAVPGLSDVTAISLGVAHTCAALGDGTVACWGFNSLGQLGDGTQTNSASPVAVPELSDVTAISLGAVHSCALLGDGTVECWGLNTSGQLGHGPITRSTAPVTVSGMTDAVAVSLGGQHSCAVLENRTLACWGFNFYGQLGNDPDLAPNALTPVPVIDLSDVGPTTTTTTPTTTTSTSTTSTSTTSTTVPVGVITVDAPPGATIVETNIAPGSTITVIAPCKRGRVASFTVNTQSRLADCGATLDGPQALRQAPQASDFDGIATTTLTAPDTPGSHVVVVELLDSGIRYEVPFVVVDVQLPATGTSNEPLTVALLLVAAGAALAVVGRRRPRPA